MTRSPTIRIARRLLPGDAEKCEAVVDALRKPCGELRARHGNVALLDGLLSLYVSLALRAYGIVGTEDALRQVAKNLPRFAATIAAAESDDPWRA